MKYILFSLLLIAGCKDKPKIQAPLWITVGNGSEYDPVMIDTLAGQYAVILDTVMRDIDFIGDSCTVHVQRFRRKVSLAYDTSEYATVTTRRGQQTYLNGRLTSCALYTTPTKP